MQDRYARDIGDYMKLGLLRHLARPANAGGTGLRVGINWYLNPNPESNSDGRRTEYMDACHRSHEPLRKCDPELMRRFVETRNDERTVASLETCGAIPLDWSLYRAALPRATGAARENWHRRALASLVHAHLVFADPDNGLTAETGSLKHAAYSELADYADREQALVVWQEHDRYGGVKADPFALSKLEQLAATVNQRPVGAVRTRRWRCRFFLITAPTAMHGDVSQSLAAYSTIWSPHVALLAR